MKIIREIEIRKFRSIKTCVKDLNCTNLNIFVGQNDNGKSNILRALNLFFNGETDIGRPFRFDDDYCYHADSGTGTRREIRIDLIIDPPTHRFKNAKPLRWTKRWKRDGSVPEERVYIESGKPVPQRDNVSKWLDKLKYRYVPAIKEQDYFNSLMGDLHDVLLEAHTGVMNAQGAGFITGIQNVTQSITTDLDKQIGVPSTIQIPSDFRILFSNLDFGVHEDNITYHLKQRGDGIKVRHIPVILKYMAEQEKNITLSGYVKPDTIWGFEEPENNLELRYAFELASAFKEYSKDIQVFVTTHSPAFYSLGTHDSSSVATFLVCRQPDKCTTVDKINLKQNSDVLNIHETMGLLPIITPYLKEAYDAQEKIRELENQIASASIGSRCMVITEDEHSESLRAILAANGFNLDETEFFSYKGKDQIKGALILALYLKNKKPEIAVLVHRDRDYLTDSELQKISSPFLSNGILFFHTDGVDVESHLLNVDHILDLGIDLTRDEIEHLIQEATIETQNDSIGRMIDHTFAISKPENGAYAKAIDNLREKYESDPIRYRYSKKVEKRLRGKIQTATKNNIKIAIPSNHLIHLELKKQANSSWAHANMAS